MKNVNFIFKTLSSKNNDFRIWQKFTLISFILLVIILGYLQVSKTLQLFSLRKNLFAIKQEIENEKNLLQTKLNQKAETKQKEDLLNKLYSMPESLKQFLIAFNYICESIPDDVSFSNLFLNKSEIKIEGQAKSLSILNAFIKDLKKNLGISVKIEGLTNEGAQSLIDFKIALNLR